MKNFIETYNQIPFLESNERFLKRIIEKCNEYKKQLLSIVQHFNNSVELLNNNAFKETKTYEQLLNDKYASQLEHYEEQNKQYQEQLNQYKQELTQGIKSPSYTKYKNLTPKQLQMLELID